MTWQICFTTRQQDVSFYAPKKPKFQHIEEVIKRIALSYPKVSFVLKHNDKVAKRFIADKEGSLATRIGAVVGQKFVSKRRTY